MSENTQTLLDTNDSVLEEQSILEQTSSDNKENIPEIEIVSDSDSFLEDNDNISDTTSFVPSKEDVEASKKLQLKKTLRQQAEHITKSPVYQAEMVFNDYMKSGQAPKYMTGHQKRQLKRQILRNARNGKYNKIFRNEDYLARFTEGLAKANNIEI